MPTRQPMLRLRNNIILSLTILAPGVVLADATQDVNALYSLVGQWYVSFLMPLGAVLAGIVVLIGGIIYITSGGDSAKTGKAKELIFGALTGLVVLVCAALIIRTLIS